LTGSRFIAATLLFAACAEPVGDAPAGVFFPTVPIGEAYPAGSSKAISRSTTAASTWRVTGSGGSHCGPRAIGPSDMRG
jgi:hypothetical protein